MTDCYPCALGVDHPWHDDGTESNLDPYRPGGPLAAPSHAGEE